MWKVAWFQCLSCKLTLTWVQWIFLTCWIYIYSWQLVHILILLPAIYQVLCYTSAVNAMWDFIVILSILISQFKFPWRHPYASCSFAITFFSSGPSPALYLSQGPWTGRCRTSSSDFTNSAKCWLLLNSIQLSTKINFEVHSEIVGFFLLLKKYILVSPGAHF